MKISRMRIAKRSEENLALITDQLLLQKVSRPFLADLCLFGSISSFIGDMKKVCLVIVTTMRGIWKKKPGSNTKL